MEINELVLFLIVVTAFVVGVTFTLHDEQQTTPYHQPKFMKNVSCEVWEMCTPSLGCGTSCDDYDCYNYTTNCKP
jgi:hypothetical protein